MLVIANSGRPLWLATMVAISVLSADSREIIYLLVSTTFVRLNFIALVWKVKVNLYFFEVFEMITK